MTALGEYAGCSQMMQRGGAAADANAPLAKPISVLERGIDAQAELPLPVLNLRFQIKSLALVFQVVLQAQLGDIHMRDVGVQPAELDAQLADALLDLGNFALEAGLGAVTDLWREVNKARVAIGNRTEWKLFCFASGSRVKHALVLVQGGSCESAGGCARAPAGRVSHASSLRQKFWTRRLD